MNERPQDLGRRRVLYVAYTEIPKDPRALRTCEALGRHGFQVEALGLSSGSGGTIAPGVTLREGETRKYQGTRMWPYLRTYSRFFREAARFVSRETASGGVVAVIVKNMPNLLVFAARAARRHGARIILDIRDSMPDVFVAKFGRVPLAHWLLVQEERWSAWYADHVLCAHEPHRQLCVEHGIDGARITPIMNLPDEELWSGVTLEPSRPPLVVFNGLVAKRTGIDILVRAFATVYRRRRGDCRLLVVGPGELYPELRAMVRDLDIEEGVDLREGGVPAREMPEILRRATLMVIPQRGDAVGRIGLPRKLLEAAYIGLPVVVSRSPAIEHYFTDEMVRYVPPEDEDALALAMEELLEDESAARRMGEAARVFADRYRWSLEQRKLVEVVLGAVPAGE